MKSWGLVLSTHRCKGGLVIEIYFLNRMIIKHVNVRQEVPLLLVLLEAFILFGLISHQIKRFLYIHLICSLYRKSLLMKSILPKNDLGEEESKYLA